MAETRRRQQAAYLALFLGIAALSLFIRLLPLGETPVRFPAPDVVLAVTLAWVVRRPDFLPALAIVGVFLLEDLLLSRPPGLWALMALAGTEFLRARNAMLRGLGFWLEYLLVSAVMLAMLLAYRLILAIVMVQPPPLGLSFLQFLGTVALYPLVVAVSHFVLGVRKPATGEVDALGQKL